MQSVDYYDVYVYKKQIQKFRILNTVLILTGKPEDLPISIGKSLCKIYILVGDCQNINKNTNDDVSNNC